MKKNEITKLFALFSLGFGSIIGVGWSVTLNNLVVIGGGPIPAILGFLLVVILLIPITLCFAELTPAIPVSGGAMAYSYKAFGPLVSFVSGWFVVLAYVSILPWEAIQVNDILSYILPGLRSGNPLYSIGGNEIYLPSLAVGLVLSFLIIALNWKFGIKVSAKIQSVLILVLMGCSLMSIVFLFYKFSPGNLTPIYSVMEGKNHSSFLTGILSIVAIGPFYFAGFDTIPQGVEKLGVGIKPNRLGKIIIFSMVGAGLFYIIILLSAGGSYPWLNFIRFDRPVLSTLLRTLYPGWQGQVLFWISLIGTLASLFSVWNGFFIASVQMLVSMSRVGFLPFFFQRQHKKYKTPIGANLFCAMVLVVGIFIGIGVIDYLTVLGSTGFMIGWFVVCISAYRLRKTQPNMYRPYQMPGGKWMAQIAAVFSMAMILNTIIPGMPGYMGEETMIVFLIWAILGITLYLYTKKRENIRTMANVCLSHLKSRCHTIKRKK